MARITDLDPIENEQVNVNADLLHVVDVSSETSVDKKMTIAKFHKTAPDASVLERGFVNTSTQAFAGAKTFSDDVTVQGDLTVNGDVYLNGTEYETHAEQLYTKKNMIITREGAGSALAADELSGIKAEHYDTYGNNGVLAFDNTGTARVGDEGDAQPLLTRSEEADLSNGQLFAWDPVNRKAVGKSIDSTPTASSTNPVTSGGTKSYIDGAIAGLDVAAVGGAGKYISAISEADGKISATATTMDSTPTPNSTNVVTSGGVKTYVDNAVASASGAIFSHNLPRLVNGNLGKDITSYYTDGTLWKRLNGTDGFSLYEDIYAGDYFQMGRPITTPNQDPQYAATGTDWVTIAGINTLAGNGDNIDMWFNHLVMIPGKGDLPGVNYFGRNRMNPTDTTAGGYYNSELHQSILGPVVSAGSTAAGATVNQQLYAEFGAHLKTTRELLTDNIGATLNNRFGSAGGASSSWAWYSCQACLMSEVEVFGATIWSSSGLDTGNAKTRLPLFNFSTKALNNKWSWYWLKDIASAALFCVVSGIGESSCYGASNAGIFVRPRFVLGA